MAKAARAACQAPEVRCRFARRPAAAGTLDHNRPYFDRPYLALVIKGQQDLISLYKSEASGGQDRRARYFMRKVLPKLRLYLKEAEALGHKIGV